jgi:hypothetical protein
MGIPSTLGRTLTDSHTESAPKVAVVNEQFVRQFFGGENPIGRRFSVGSRKGIEIVGVVGDAQFYDIRKVKPPTAYLPYLQYIGDLNPMHFEARTAGEPMTIVSAVRHVVQNMDPRLALYAVRSQTEQINQTLFQQRFHRLDFSLFKEFQTTENTHLEFRAEFFNITNTPQFSTPLGPTGGSAVVSAPGALDFKSVNFGKIAATRDTPNDPRIIQFALKFYW